MDRNMKDILGTVNFIKDYMIANMLTKDEGATKEELTMLATKSDLQQLREEMRTSFKEIREELTNILQRLEIVEELVQQHKGFTKEIDHLLSRAKRLENLTGFPYTETAMH